MNVLGIDIGTTSISASVIDALTGNVLKSKTIDNHTFLKSNHNWESLQDPNAIYNIVNGIVESFLQEFPNICSIGLTGQMHGIVYINSEGEAVGPLYTWQDERGNLDFTEGVSYTAYLSEKTGYNLATGFGLVTHFFNRKNNLVPKDAKHIYTISDYVAMKLTNEKKPFMHASNAASLGAFDLNESDFDKKVLELMDISCDILPPITKDIKIVGVTKEDLPVTVAIGDNQASFFGSVRKIHESVLVNIGTGSQISLLSSEPIFSEDAFERRPLVEEKSLLVGAPLCGGKSYALLEQFFESVLQLSNIPVRSLFSSMNNISLMDVEEHELPTIIPTFNGTRKNPTLKASINYLTSQNFTAKHFILAMIDGIVRELYDLYMSMMINRKHKVSSLVGSGNGIRKNPLLRNRLIKLFKLDLKVPLHDEEAAYGACLSALVGKGIYDDIEKAQKIIKYKDEDNIE